MVRCGVVRCGAVRCGAVSCGVVQDTKSQRPSTMRVYLLDGSAQTICTCCHTEVEVADQIFHLAQSQYADTGPTSPITDPATREAWQGSHCSAIF